MSDQSFDIDLGGDFDLSGTEEKLPPGVLPGRLPAPEEVQAPPEAEVPPPDVPWDGTIREGSLTGEDSHPPFTDPPTAPEDDPEFAPSRGEVFTDDLTKEAEAAEGVGIPPTPPTPQEPETPVETSPVDAEETSAPAAKKKPAAKKRAPRRAKGTRKQAAKPAATQAPAPLPDVATGNGKSGTPDRLYVIFLMKNVEVDGNIVEAPIRVTFTDEAGAKVEGVRARNRDIAESKAAKTFGEGWRGEIVAVPENYWQPHELFNKPDGGFTPQRVGA